jgi:BirA family biotin operon repressor/biotin-[acetyl-CoA-carboxylase] ligase
MTAAARHLVVRHDTVDSTQAVAFALAERGAADGTVVVADYQRAGRGRRQRPWQAAPGTSLLASVLLRPRLDPEALPQLSLVTAVAVADALARVAVVAPRLKWPNDVLVGGRKIAGILLESRLGPSPVVVVGVGVNLTQAAFPEPLAHTATSVVLETGASVDREVVLQTVVAELDAWRARHERDGFAPVRARWLALGDTLGRDVAIGEVRGRAVDLAGDGALVVDDGRARHAVTAGELAAAPPGR